MQINTSQISMDASVDHRDVRGRGEQINSIQEEGRPQFQLKLPGNSEFSLQRTAENRQSQNLCASSAVRCSGENKEYQLEADQVLERMVQELSGQRVRLRTIGGLPQDGRITLSTPVNPPGRPVPFTFVSHSLQYEYERVEVRSSGTVQLEDGRSLNFSMDLNMERESLVRESVAWQSAANILMDPLILNFDCDLRGLMSRRFDFDLDSDGSNDEICSLRPGTGFLALDLNNDQQINNGRELFGPSSGCGFAELAMYDEDRNGWIDERDPVFAKLRIFKPGEPDNSELLSLAEAGVGAICLTNMTTPFQLKDRDNRSMGEVAATGVFLTEKGEVRPIQEIKLSLKSIAEGETNSVLGENESDAMFFIKKLITLRQTEVQALAALRGSREEDEKRWGLLSQLFPDFLAEKGAQSG